jgi:hypothetical protein
VKTTANEKLLADAQFREARLDQRMPEVTYGSAEYWRSVAELCAVRREILALERTIALQQRKPDFEASRSGRVLLVCPLHSKPGVIITAILKPGARGETVAVCPRCIEDGGEIRRQRGLELLKDGQRP